MEFYKVVGVDDLDGVIFCYCSTYEKAEKAVELLANEAGIDRFSLCIVQDEFSLDQVWIDDESVDL